MNRPKNYSKLKWEQLEEISTGAIEENTLYRKKIRRAQVQGGWLVECEVHDQAAGFGVGLTFVPDQQQSWQLDEDQA